MSGDAISLALSLALSLLKENWEYILAPSSEEHQTPSSMRSSSARIFFFFCILCLHFREMRVFNELDNFHESFTSKDECNHKI